jgi:chaperonin GroES
MEIRMTKVKVVGDKILVVPEEVKTETQSGIVIPKGKDRYEDICEGIVAEVGPGAGDAGKRTPLTTKVGDKILYKTYRPDEFIIDGVKYHVIGEYEIVAILE